MELFTYENQLYLITGLNGNFVIAIKAERGSLTDPEKYDKIHVENGAAAQIFEVGLVAQLVKEQIEIDKKFLLNPAEPK